MGRLDTPVRNIRDPRRITIPGPNTVYRCAQLRGLAGEKAQSVAQQLGTRIDVIHDQYSDIEVLSPRPAPAIVLLEGVAD